MEKNYLLILKSLVLVWYLLLQKIKRLKLFKKQPTLSKYALSICFLLFTVLLQSQTIKYVTVNGSGSKDGSSWSNASENLQKMISLSESGTQVWIAKGTYTPKVALAPNSNTQDRNNTFGLKKDVKLYGGFAGNETSVSQRNIVANETILSGNLGGGNYAHHVVLIYAVEENENYYLNGLTISDGKADILDYYKISTETKSISANDNIKNKFPDWYVSMTESPYYNYASLGLQLAGLSGLPGIPSVVGGDMTTTKILNTSYPKSNGGAIYNIKGVLTLENVTFKNNQGITGGAICLQEGARTTLTNCIFSNNKATDNGGGISSSASYLTITGGSFNTNSSTLGGAIADLGGKLLNINNVSFSDNQAYKTKTDNGFGGAIYIEKANQDNASSRIINNCTFDNNSAEVAGVLYADENINNLKITNSAFNGNNALMTATSTLAGGGGAITLRRVINAEITSNNFTNNKASKSIGGVFLLVETNGVKFSGNTFSGNTSLLGGALCSLQNKNTVSLTGNTFTGNTATATSSYDASGLGGAIVSANDNNVKISDNIFTGNTAKQGGAINFETNTVNSIVNNNTFKTNSSTMYGGAIFASASDNTITTKVTINGNNFESNNSTERGGGIFLNKSAITTDIYNNSFIGNKSLIGAVVDIENDAKNQFFNNTVRGNVGTTNSEGESGSIIAAMNGVTKLYNNVFTGNQSFTAVFYSDSTIDFVNNTVWNESSDYGIYMFSKKIKLYNNILEELRGTSTSADVHNNSFRYDVQNNFVNKNNNIRETNLYFADAATYNFNLTGCSPIINRGNNSLYSSEYPNTDFSGKNRKVNTIDIGAYENELGASGKTVPTVVSAQAFCNEAIVNDLKATGSNIKWYTQALGGSPLASNTSLTSGNTYYASQTVNGCESDRASVTVSISSTEAPTAQSPQNFIIGQPGARIVVNGSNLKWYSQEKEGTALTGFPSLNMSSENSATYWVSQTNANNCESIRTKIVVNVTKIPLTIKAINKVKVFDGSVYGNTNYTVSYSGFETGDSQSNSVSGSLAFSGDAATATEPGIYKIIPQGITSSKYTVLYEEGTLEIKSSLILTDNILYVKQSGNGDGSSWNSPLNNLELALTRASNINSVHTDDNDPKRVKKIFVAKGTYQLASGKSYIMPKNIEIYGGFDPDNAVTNLTHQRITGNLNDGSILRGNNASVIKNDDNSLTNNALLNGFTITNGNANNGGGIYNKKVAAKFENCIIRTNIATTNGGAVYNENANTTWTNCLIINNTAPNGASMYNNASLPTLLNATIADNTGAQGAALYNANSSSPRIVNSVSVKNSSDIVNNSSNPTYENSLIQGFNTTSTTSIFDVNYSLLTNSPALNAGKNIVANMILPAKDLKGKSRIIDTNVDMGVFERNKTQTITASAITKKYGDEPFTHGTASSGLPLEYTSSNTSIAIIENGKIKPVGTGTATITLKQSGNDSEYDAASQTEFILTVNKAALTVTADNKLFFENGSVFKEFSVNYTGFVLGDTPSTALGGAIAYGGTAVTATTIGKYDITPSGLTSLNYNITYNNGKLTIESDVQLTDGTIYVKKGSAGKGTSWDDALGEVAEGLKLAHSLNTSIRPDVTKANKIYVAKGTYAPKYSPKDSANFADEDTDNSFLLVDGVKIYGGFDGSIANESISNRQIQKNKTILDSYNPVTGQRVHHIVIASNSTGDNEIDGFTIMNGDGGFGSWMGSGATMTIKGKQITQAYGSGIRVHSSILNIKNCIITGNSSGNQAGAMYITDASNVSVFNTLFYDNSAIHSGASGTSMVISEATVKIYNSTFGDSQNAFQIVTNHANANLQIYNSIFRYFTDTTHNDINKSRGTITVNNSFLPNSETFYSSKGFVLANNIYNVDPGFIDVNTNNFALKTSSVVVDKGDNSFYNTAIYHDKDIADDRRVQNSTIDMGCFESKLPQTITASDLTKNYGDSDFVNEAVTVNTGLPLTYTKSSNITVAAIVNGKIHTQNTGTTTITVAVAGNQTYAPTEKTFVLTVGKAALTVKANDKTKFANNLAMSNADYNVSYTGFVNGDDSSKLTGSLVYSGDAIGKTAVGIYTNGIIPGGLSSNNYTFIYKEGTLKIIPNTTLTNNTLYVKQGTVGGDGSTWQLALNDLSLALRHAAILNNNTPNTVNKIFVAKGTYTPKYSVRDNSNFIDEGRDNSFLVLDGVKLYGGFDGNITDENLTDRRIQENKTILDGQSVINHIITVSNAAGNNEIDGFTISKGTAGSAAHGTEGTVIVNGKSITREYGGGIRVHSSNLIVKNCILSENSSGFRAGGMYVTDNSNVSIYNTLFYGNSAYHAGANGTSIAINDANVKIVNTTFGDNIGNSAHILTGGASSSLEVFNAVFRNLQGNNDINRTGGIVTVRNSLLSKAQSQYSSMTLANNFYAQPADFIDENANNFVLKTTSAAVNKGDNALYNTVIAGNKDIANNNRFLSTTIDMGCYESKIAQTITANDITKKYTDADFVIGSTSSGLSPLTYSSANTNVAYITKDNKIHIVGVGEAIITVAQNGDEIYASVSKSFKLTVGKGDFSITLNPQTYTYDGAAKYLNVSGLPAGTSVSYEGNGQINAGEHIVKANINGGDYYNDFTVSNTLKINKKDLSGISFTQKTFTYDGFDKHPEVGGTLPEGVNVVYSNTQKNAGVYNNVKASISGSNYNILELTTSMTINKADLSTAIFLLEKEEVYDGTTKRLSLDGILPDGVTTTYTNNDNINVGSYNVTVNINGGINYNNKQLIAKLTIVKGNLTDNFVLASNTYIYDGSEKSLTIQGTLPNQVSVSYTNNNKREVGEYKVYAVLSKPNYNDKIVEADLFIKPKTIDVIAQGEISKVYNADAVIALNANNFALQGVVDGDNVLLDTPVAGDLNNKNVGESKPVTINNLKLSGTDSKNYVLSSTSLTANIAIVKPKNLEVSLKGNVTKIFDATTKAVLSNANFDLTGVVENETVTLNNTSLGEYDTKDVGKNKTITVSNLTISGNDALNYTLNAQKTSGQIGEITSKAIKVTADALQAKVYGAIEPTLGYTVTPSLVSGDSFTGTLERAVGEGVGTYAIAQGTLSAGANYTLTYVAADFKITPKPITVTADASQTKVYGAADSAFTYSVSPSLVGNDAFSGSLERVIGANVGTYAIGQGTLTAGANYTITYTAKDFEITAKTIVVTAASQTKVYGEADSVLTYSFTPSLESGDSFTGTLSRALGENIGAYAIGQGTLTAGSNYSINYVSKDYTITAKSITVKATVSQNKIYGAADPVFTYLVSPSLVRTDSFTGTLSRAIGENIGFYTIEQGNLSAGSNYTITFESKDFEITPKEITVTAKASQNKIYGATDPVFTYTSSEALVDGDTFSGSLSRVNGENAGTYDYTIGSLSAGSNYTVTLIGSNTFAIAAKPIAVTADASQIKVYGAADPIFTYSVTPSLVGNDTFSGALERVIGENVGTYAIGQGTLTAGANYAITYTAKDFEITAKTIAVTAVAQTKVYGEADSVLTYSFTPSLESGDSFTGTLSRVLGENIGAYEIGQGTLTAGSNYSINYVSKDYTITAKPITVTAAISQKKVYGAADPAFSYLVSPSLVGTDAFTGTLSRVIGENVGSYAIEQGNLSSGSNYTITFESKDFEITPKGITVTADASQAKVYGNVEPMLTYTASEALATGNTFSGSLSRVNGENVGAYNYTIGSLKAGSNYTVTLIGSNTFAITAKPITVAADASQTKVYGTADPVFTYSVSPSLVGNDKFSGVLKRVVGENVGTYAIGQGTLTAGGNYAITYTGKDFEITKADQIITWNQTLVSNCDGATTSILTASSNSGLPIMYVSSNADVVTISNDELIFNKPGSATITASQAGNNNYNAAQSISLPVLNSQPNLIKQQFDNVIFFDNSSKEFKAYTWYKNGILVAGQTLQYYKEAGGLNGTYHAVATKLDGTFITSCPLTLSSTGTVESVRIFPNPVRSNASYQLITNLDASKMLNAHIEVFGMSGSLVDQKTTNENDTTLLAPAVEGIYIVRITLANGKTFTKNLLVKN